jgi:hypothetical protein
MIECPYSIGYEEALMGFELCDNPYDYGTDAYGEYRRGMLDALSDCGE